MRGITVIEARLLDESRPDRPEEEGWPCVPLEPFEVLVTDVLIARGLLREVEMQAYIALRATPLGTIALALYQAGIR